MCVKRVCSLEPTTASAEIKQVFGVPWVVDYMCMYCTSASLETPGNGGSSELGAQGERS